MSSPGPRPPHRAPDAAVGKGSDRVPGSTLERPVWTPENQNLLRRFLEGARTPGAADAPGGPMPSSGAIPGLFDRTLEMLRGSNLVTRTLGGRLHYEPNMPAVQLPEEPVRSLLEHLVEGGLRDNVSAQPYCHVGLRDADEGSVTLYVRDNGPPLPECSMEALHRFLREARVERIPDRVYRLMLADTLARWLGGALWIGPPPNGTGATVFVRLPRKLEDPEGGFRPALVGRHVF